MAPARSSRASIGGGGDFMGPGRHHCLGQRQPALTGVGADRVQGRPTVAPVVRALGGLAVQSHHLPGEQTVQGLHPPGKPRLQLLRVEEGKDPAKGVVGGDAVRQAQPPLELLHLGVGTATAVRARKRTDVSGCLRAWTLRGSDTSSRQLRRDAARQGAMTGTPRGQQGPDPRQALPQHNLAIALPGGPGSAHRWCYTLRVEHRGAQTPENCR